MSYKFPVSRPSISSEDRLFVLQALDRVHLTMGPWVERFEAALADYLLVRHVVTTTSGTTALHLVLAALDIGPGDEVIVPDVTFVATANAVRYVGAQPVLVDVDPNTWGLDPLDIGRKTTDRTKAIIPVHLYGAPAAPGWALTSAGEHDPFRIIEDAAEGLGGYSSGKALGTLGDAGVYSFYGNKVLTTGEGGAVVTNSDLLARRLRFLRGQAMDPEMRYYHPDVGFNYRMTDLQAALGCGQMVHLDARLLARRQIVARYQERLCYYGTWPHVRQDDLAAPWLFTLQLRPDINRDRLMRYLAERGVETRPTFVPLHRLPPYAESDAGYPNAVRLGEQGVSLPTFPELTADDVEEICDIFEEGVKDGSR